MTQAIKMPRVEIVGSFLPPEELENALNEKVRGNLSEADYHAAEDRVLDRLIDREIEAGLHIVTDGEMRRKSWDRDFWEGFEGMNREKIVEISRKHGGEKYVKSFDGYTHLLTMLYAVIQRFDSLREIETSMTAEVRKLHHVGIGTVPKRSTLSDANARR